MPTYSYKCTECGTAFDIQQAFTDDTLTECPNCGGKLRKIFSAVGVTFNGSGFYRNDSREKKSTSDRPAKSSSESSSSSGSSSGSSSDSSPSSAPTKTADSKPSSPAQSTPAASPTKAAG